MATMSACSVPPPPAASIVMQDVSSVKQSYAHAIQKSKSNNP
jgi:hypothetical protein